MIAPVRTSRSRCAGMAVILSIACVLCALLAPSMAMAGAATGREIRRAESFMAEAEFEQALDLVNRQLNKGEKMSSKEKGRLYELQGMLNLYLGDEAAAAESFKLLLRAAPTYSIQEDASPKVKSMFAEAREQLAVEISASMKFRHPRPKPAQQGAPIAVSIQLENVPKGVQAKLFYRRGGSGFSDVLFMEEPEDPQIWTATVPALDFSDARLLEASRIALEYYIEIYAPGGTLLAVAGKKDSPLSVALALPGAPEEAGNDGEDMMVAGSPWYKKWWVWTIVGVVVAGAVTGGVIYAMSEQTGTVPFTVTVE